MVILNTSFAPAERASDEEVERQHRKLCCLPFVDEFLDAMPAMSVILNEHRQIVFANLPFVQFLGFSKEDDLLGLCQCEDICVYSKVLGSRPGEAIGCVRAHLNDGGCGTSKFCQHCGAVISILNSQKSNVPDVQECHLVCCDDNGKETTLDFRVWSHPIYVDHEAFVAFSILNITHEEQRKALERIFFHDVLNTATGVKGLADLLGTTGMSDDEVLEVASMLSETTDLLIEEIQTQRMLSDAEHGELAVSILPVQSMALMCQVIQQFRSVSYAKNKGLGVGEDVEHVEFLSDPVLIRRVLTNLVKNALEAVLEESLVVLNCYLGRDSFCFTVHHGLVMSPEAQHHLFSRSFSTKGSDRGLGMYSVKLITEKYLQGRVSFVSNEDVGTLFTVTLPLSLRARQDEC